MIHRDVTEFMQSIAPKMPVTCILGPRQAGKTTLIQHCFSSYKYFSCDKETDVALIEADPAAFLHQQLATNPGLIIDEFQYCPRILPAIKNYVDETQSKGRIVLTGSQNYLMMATITQSLAGRVALIDLLPLSINELQQADVLPSHIDALLFQGSYPRLYTPAAPPKNVLYTTYIQTYLERDIRTLKNVSDLAQFHKFIQLCANRIGQLLNLSSLASEAGISIDTAQQWISLLETCYVVFRLQPHFVNFNKTLTKSPKLYFYDTGLVTQLLGMQSDNALANNKIRGSLFENFVISECIKWFNARGERPNLYFWRDQEGHEIDLIIDRNLVLTPVEIKSADTARNTMTDELVYWHNTTGHPLEDSYVIYTGPEDKSTKGPQFVPWENIPTWLSKLLA